MQPTELLIGWLLPQPSGGKSACALDVELSIITTAGGDVIEKWLVSAVLPGDKTHEAFIDPATARALVSGRAPVAIHFSVLKP